MVLNWVVAYILLREMQSPYSLMVFSGHVRPSHLKTYPCVANSCSFLLVFSKFSPLLVCLPKGSFPQLESWSLLSFSCLQFFSVLTSTFKFCILWWSSPVSKIKSISCFSIRGALFSNEFAWVNWVSSKLWKQPPFSLYWVLSDTRSKEHRDLQQPAHPFLLCNCYWTAAMFQLKNMSILFWLLTDLRALFFVLKDKKEKGNTL